MWWVENLFISVLEEYSCRLHKNAVQELWKKNPKHRSRILCKRIISQNRPNLFFNFGKQYAKAQVIENYSFDTHRVYLISSSSISTQDEFMAQVK